MKAFLPDHEVTTVQERGWSSIDNGELLGLARTEFGVFVTADQGIPHKQNLGKFDIAVIVLAARSNRIEDSEPLADSLRAAVEKSRAVRRGTRPLNDNSRQQRTARRRGVRCVGPHSVRRLAA